MIEKLLVTLLLGVYLYLIDYDGMGGLHRL